MLSTFIASSSSVFKFFPYFLLFIITVVEGPIATLAGGALSFSGLLQPIPVYFCVILGNLSADMGWFTLGRLGKVNWLLSLGSKLGIDPRVTDQLTIGIQSYAPRLLFLSKFTVGFPIPTLIATGIGKVPIRRWIGWLVLGELIKSAGLVSAGYFFSRTIERTQGTVQTMLWVITGILFLAGIIWFKVHKKRMVQETNHST
jgi:membrane protein DedA with SNARE-associated domain